jgi:hypothetical protein
MKRSRNAGALPWASFKVVGVAGAGLLATATATQVFASAIALDTASNSPPYSTNAASNSFNGLNGGTGFGAWTVTVTNPSVTGPGGSFVGPTSGTNASASAPTPGLTTAGTPVWDIYNNGNPNGNGTTTTLNSSITTAVRPFTAGGDGNTYLEAGQTFTFTASMGNGSGGTSNQEGYELLDSSGNVLFNIFTDEAAASGNGTNQAWSITDANGTTADPDGANGFGRINASAEEFQLVFGSYNATDSELSYQLNLSGHHGAADWYNGEISMTTGGATQFAFYDNAGGNGSDVEVGGLQITGTGTAVPEPGVIVLGSMGLVTLSLRRRPA